MTKNGRKVLWPLLVIGLLVLTAFTLVASGKLRRSNFTHTESADAQNLNNRGRVKRPGYVRRSNLSPRLVWNLNALGDRLERPGKERLSVTGTLRRAGDGQPEEVAAVFEYPERLRLTLHKGNQTRVMSFDGEESQPTESSAEAADRDLIETLVYSSAEHFFATQMLGQATRFLGSRFRIDDGLTADYNGPYYDIYKVADQIKTEEQTREQLKLFYFNSDTLLLERVSYEIERNGATIKVEERLNGWTREQGQQTPRRIERFENGESVFVFTVRAAGLSASANDGLFAK